MTRTRNLLIAGTAGIVLLGAGGLAVADQHRGRDGWRDAPRGIPGLARICSERRDEFVGAILGRAERALDLTPEQRPAWDDLEAAVGRAEARVDQACAQLQAQRAGGGDDADRLRMDPPARLAALETMMSAGLDALREVRPAADSLYQQLTPEQRATVERLTRHGRGWDRGRDRADRPGLGGPPPRGG